MNKTNKLISNCCRAEMKVVGGDEGTYFWQCLECGKGCDLYVKSKSKIVTTHDPMPRKGTISVEYHSKTPPSKVIGMAAERMEDAVATAQWLQTRQEWEKHIGFIRRHVGMKLTKHDLDTSIEWYERIFGKYPAPKEANP